MGLSKPSVRVCSAVAPGSHGFMAGDAIPPAVLDAHVGHWAPAGRAAGCALLRFWVAGMLRWAAGVEQGAQLWISQGALHVSHACTVLCLLDD